MGDVTGRLWGVLVTQLQLAVGPVQKQDTDLILVSYATQCLVQAAESSPEREGTDLGGSSSSGMQFLHLRWLRKAFVIMYNQDKQVRSETP